jgi:hypothetical protein
MLRYEVAKKTIPKCRFRILVMFPPCKSTAHTNLAPRSKDERISPMTDDINAGGKKKKVYLLDKLPSHKAPHDIIQNSSER